MHDFSCKLFTGWISVFDDNLDGS